MSLSIVYQTCREEPKIEWFLDSLKRELGDFKNVKLIIVDFCKEQRPLPISNLPWETVHTSPMPNHYNGPHRLTKEDWFAAATSRNTGLCYASDGHVVFVDDLSVLMPGWFTAVQDMMKSNYIACGAYHKVKNLVVENGEVKSYTPSGLDHRYGYGSDSGPVPCEGGWLYGCSCGGPIEAFLSVGGFPAHLADGISSEDYCFGIVASTAGWHLKYDRRMMTFESEELHHVGKVMIRRDKGKSPADKSHKLLEIVRSGITEFNNYYEGGIRQLRLDTLAGKPFPPCRMPIFDWFDGQKISDFTP